METRDKLFFHFKIKPISRNQGRSAVGAAAYRAGDSLYNEYDGVTHDYTNRRGAVSSAAYRAGEVLSDGSGDYDFTNKGGIPYSEIILPEGAPQEFLDRQTLWNAVEKAEVRRDARLAREAEIGLPVELSLDEHIALVREFVKDNFVSHGLGVDFSIHSGHKAAHDKDNEHEEAEHDSIIESNNPHVHVLITDRPIGKDGFLPAKIPELNKRQYLIMWRKNWADAQNKEFERKGLDIRVSHESYKKRGIKRTPTKHLGFKAAALERKGVRTERGDENRAIMAQNKERENVEQLRQQERDAYNIKDREQRARELERVHIEKDKLFNEQREKEQKRERELAREVAGLSR